ncbi:hypothetical protein U1Q18_035356 [Sarracenia purpurea var. burkii]
MTVIFFVLAILVVGNVDSATPAAPSPVDCSSVILNLADCLSYVSAGSTVKKPEGTCCSGLKTILDTSPECLCEGLKSSSSFGITLDMNRAINLPKVCHLTASPPTCQLGPGTGGASPETPELQRTGGAGLMQMALIMGVVFSRLMNEIRIVEVGVPRARGRGVKHLWKEVWVACMLTVGMAHRWYAGQLEGLMPIGLLQVGLAAVAVGRAAIGWFWGVGQVVRLILAGMQPLVLCWWGGWGVAGWVFGLLLVSLVQ